MLPIVAALVASLGAGSAAAATGRYYYAGVMKATTATTQYGVGGRILIANPAVAYSADQVTSEMSIVHGANVALMETGYPKFGTAYPTLMIVDRHPGVGPDGVPGTVLLMAHPA